MAQWLMKVQFLALLSGLRFQHCHELWCRSQTQLRFCVAVAVAQDGGHSSNSTPSLGTSTCRRYNPKRQKDKKKRILGCAAMAHQEEIVALPEAVLKVLPVPHFLLPCQDFSPPAISIFTSPCLYPAFPWAWGSPFPSAW